MKRFLIYLVALTMILTLAGCSRDEDSDNSEKAPETIGETGENNDYIDGGKDNLTVDNQTSDDNSGAMDTDDGASAGEKTLGETLRDNFLNRTDDSSSLEGLAEAIMNDPAVSFAKMTSPVEPGLLSGFGNTEINGFSEGIKMAPMVGTIPFIGYIFNLSAEADADEFINTLRESADLRWNICTEADETVIEHSGNRVFFLMCPKTIEE